MGGVVFAAAMSMSAWQVAWLVGWDAAAVAMVAGALRLVVGCDSEGTAASSENADPPRLGADVLLVAAGVASLAGIGLALLKAAKVGGAAQGWITALAVVSVVLSWAVVQTVFTLHYARLYYFHGGGIDFNNDGENPDYWDFAYLAVTIGMTYQVSDTNLTTKVMRRTATRQGLLSYVFGTFVVAMTINVVAGLIR